MVTIGCRGGGGFLDGIVAQPNSTIELLESELRWYEDNLYRLDDELDSCLHQLESARRNNAQLRSELARALKADSSQQNESQDRGSAVDPLYDEERAMDDPLYQLPKIELGEPAQEPIDLPASDTPDAAGDQNEPGETPDEEFRMNGPRPTDPPPDEGKNSASPIPGQPIEGDSVDKSDRVTRIVLNRRLTGGYNFDGQPGHDGVMVVVEPQNSQSQYVPMAGEVTVELRDPARTGVAGRIGKWKFDTLETSARIKQSVLGEGIHLQLPWPDAPPKTDRLALTVVMQTNAGQELQASQVIRIQPTHGADAESLARGTAAAWSPTRSDTATLRSAAGWRPVR